jgi:hypothetical protein
MTTTDVLKITGKGLVAGAALAGIGYAALIAYHRATYGRVKPSALDAENSSIGRFIPNPEVVEHHQIAIDAPADVVLSTARQMEVNSPLIRSIFKARELMLGGEPDTRPHPAALIEQMRSIGWVILSETPDHEIVMGAVTRPWEAAPAFRSIPAAEFRDFAEPGYVKIAWTLRAEPVGDRSIFHTDTRVGTTDRDSRERFRRYWSFVAPGVELIRRAMLRPLKAAAERKMLAVVAA